MYASVNYAIIGPDNYVSSVRRKAIVLTNDDLALFGFPGRNINEI